MGGTHIEYVKYIDGYSDLGEQTIQVRIIAYPSNLSIFNRQDNTPLFSIPWGNFSNVQEDFLQKTGLASGGAFLLRSIPVIGVLKSADPYYVGFRIDFWDEEIQRRQEVFFSTGTEPKAKRVVREIMHHRDNYFRIMKRSSDPTRRE